MNQERTYECELRVTDVEPMQVVAKGGQGANEAFAKINSKYANHIRNYIYGKIRDSDAADILTQEVLVRMWVSAASYRPRGKFTQWWKSIARNIVRDWLSASKREPSVTQLLSPEVPRDAPATVELVLKREEDAGKKGYPELLIQALDKTLEEMQSPIHVSRWRRASAYERSKTEIARAEGVSWQKFEQSLAKVEGFASAGTLVNALLLAEPKEAACALLSEYTLDSPAKFKIYYANDRRTLPDRRLGIPFWNPGDMRAFDKICGLTPGRNRPEKGWLSVPDSLKLGTAFKELIIQSAQDICQVLTNPRLEGRVSGARRVIRDVGYIICGARVLQKDGQSVIKEATRLLRKAGVLENINLQRQIPTIQAYTGTAGELSRWYDRVMREDYEKRLDTALLITYLAGPRHNDTFAKALVWGHNRDIEYVLAWAKRMQRTVSPRWLKYIRYCLENTMYAIVPDLGKMVTCWPVELVNVVGIDHDHQMEIESRLEQFIDESRDRDLRRTAEKTLITIRLP